jgi:hypothetical protein
MAMELSEFDLLRTCALRIDGYAWARDQDIERDQLLKSFWHEEARDDLFARSWDYQWAAWFMQQRSLEWTSSPPDADTVALWRRFFLLLADKRPSPPFDRGGPDGDPASVRRWERRYAPHLRALKGVVADRLARGAALDEPIRIDGA